MLISKGEIVVEVQAEGSGVEAREGVHCKSKAVERVREGTRRAIIQYYRHAVREGYDQRYTTPEGKEVILPIPRSNTSGYVQLLDRSIQLRHDGFSPPHL